MPRPNSLEKALMLGKVERKRRRQPTVTGLDSVMVAMKATLEDLKVQLGADPPAEGLCMWSLGVENDSMAL